MCTPDAAPCNNYTLYKIVSPVRSRLRFIVPNNSRLECRENYAGELPGLLFVDEETDQPPHICYSKWVNFEETCGVDRKSMGTLRTFRNNPFCSSFYVSDINQNSHLSTGKKLFKTTPLSVLNSLFKYYDTHRFYLYKSLVNQLT